MSASFHVMVSGTRSGAVGCHGCGEGALEHAHGAGELCFQRLHIKRPPVLSESVAAVKCVETVWVSVRSASVKPSFSVVGPFGQTAAARIGADFSGVKGSAAVAMTGASLVPVIVIVNGTKVARLSAGVIRIDLRPVGQRQRFARAEEVESLVRDLVGPGRRAEVGVARGLHHDHRDFFQRGMSFSSCAAAAMSWCCAFW